MSLTQEQIKKISENLSKISSPKEKIAKDLNEILKYFDLLNEVNTDSVKPTYSVITKENILREDIELKEKKQTREDLLKCSNQKIIADQIAISNIMK